MVVFVLKDIESGVHVEVAGVCGDNESEEGV